MEAGGCQRLIRLIGRSLAKEIIFTGRVLSSWDALQFGLINYVEENGEKGLNKALELGKKICKNVNI
jgi:enoyl-CoA hydratase/carnithine racemase